MPVKDVAIVDLLQEPIRRSRAHLDPERVAHYVGNLDDASPVVVYDIDGQLLVADGYHRVAAAQRLGRAAIRADVRAGDRADALSFAVELAQRQRGLTEEEVLAAIMRRGEGPRDTD